MKEQFVEKNFAPSTLQQIDRVNYILDEHHEMGYTLSLRQIHYALVSKDWMPNTEKDYLRLKRNVGNGREAGLIDWAMVVDRLRLPYQVHTVLDQQMALDEMVENYKLNKWFTQPNHVEVMAEKDTETGVLWPVCRELEVPFHANRGYSSKAAMYRAAKRIREAFDRGQHPVVLYVGDHDPSGLDMDRDIEERLATYAGLSTVPVGRLALTMTQIEALNPPPNPAKFEDPRAAWYIEKHGTSSWETAALSAPDLADIVRQAVLQLRDNDLWQEAVDREEEDRRKLKEFTDDFDGFMVE